MDQTGMSVSLRSLFAADQPVALNFFYDVYDNLSGYDSDICADQSEVGDAGNELRLVSISINPRV